VWAVVIATRGGRGPASASAQDTAKGTGKVTAQDTAHARLEAGSAVPDTGKGARTAAVARDSLIGRRARPEIQQVAIRGAHAIPAGDIESSI